MTDATCGAPSKPQPTAPAGPARVVVPRLQCGKQRTMELCLMSNAAAPSAAEVLAKGLEGIIAGETSICSVEQGGVFYRGYEIDELSKNASFEEVAFLLLEGHKPSADELKRFKGELVAERAIPGQVIDFLKSAGPSLKAGTA